jgi:hypothetical protein
MSLVAVWRSVETDSEPSRLWMAADSRITDRTGTLLNEGCKLFSLPIRCRQPTPEGSYSLEYYSTTIGMACVGGSLTYHNVYGTLVPLLTNLICDQADVPCMAYMGILAARITSAYVQSLWQARGEEALQVELVFGGYCGVHSQLEAYRIVPAESVEPLGKFRSSGLDMTGDDVYFFGAHLNEAHSAFAEFRAGSEHPVSRILAPLRVIRFFVNSSRFATIGGDVQVGFTMGRRFERVASVQPEVDGHPAAVMRVNNIDLNRLGGVGPCRIGIMGYAGG